MSNFKFINPDTLSKPTGYSHVAKVMSGQPIYISGQVGLDATGKLAGEGDLRAQTVQVFENLKAALEAANATFANVVKLSLYLRDISQIGIVREVRSNYIDSANLPTSTAVEVKSLFREDILIEIEAIAIVDY